MLPPQGTARVSKSAEPIDPVKAFAMLRGIDERAAREKLRPAETSVVDERRDDDSDRYPHR